jgi:hypothetical protein
VRTLAQQRELCKDGQLQEYERECMADVLRCGQDLGSPLSKASGRLADMGRKFIVVRTELDSIAGRKVNVSGSIESLRPDALDKGEQLT